MPSLPRSHPLRGGSRRVWPADAGRHLTAHPMKYALHTSSYHSSPFELDGERILCNDVKLPWEGNYHNTRLWVIWHEFGPVCAVWADCEQDALDTMVDEDLGGAFLLDDDAVSEATEEEREEWASLGNAGEYADLTYCGIAPVVFDLARDCRLLCAFAEARGEGRDTLAD